MFIYHYTYESRLNSILQNGLVPSSGYGENLPFIMGTRKEYKPTNGPMVYLKIELEDDDSKLVSVNREWVEYYGVIPPQKIVAIARDFTNEQVFEYIRNGGDIDSFDSVFCQYVERW